MKEKNLIINVENVGGRTSPMTALSHAAYLTGQVLTDSKGQAHDQPANIEKLEYSALMLPSGAGEFFGDNREAYWNAVDGHASAKRKDARRTKTHMIALPYELPPEAYSAFIEKAVAPFLAAGLGVEVAIHDDGTNPHLHLSTSFFAWQDGAFVGTQYSAFRGRSFVAQERRRLAAAMTDVLAAHGIPLVMKGLKDKASKGKERREQHRGPDPVQRRKSAERARDKERLRQKTRGQMVQNKERYPWLEAGLERMKAAREERARPIEEHDLRQPTREERELYPNLTRLDDWPPPESRHGLKLSFSQIREFDRYWRNQRLEFFPRSPVDEDRRPFADQLRERGAHMFREAAQELEREKEWVGRYNDWRDEKIDRFLDRINPPPQMPNQDPREEFRQRWDEMNRQLEDFFKGDFPELHKQMVEERKQEERAERVKARLERRERRIQERLDRHLARELARNERARIDHEFEAERLRDENAPDLDDRRAVHARDAEELEAREREFRARYGDDEDHERKR